MIFGRRACTGFTLIELIVAVLVMGLLTGYAAPRLRNALEQGRTNLAMTNLQAIATAQHLYFYENAVYAANLSTLESAGLLDRDFVTGADDTSAIFDYATSNSAGGTNFSASASRLNSSVWSGSLSIDYTGAMSGTITNSYDGVTISPVATE